MNRLLFLKKSRVHFVGRSVRDRNVTTFFTIGSRLEPVEQILIKFTFFFNTPTPCIFRMLCKRVWESRVISRCEVWSFRLVAKQRYNVLDILWSFMWKDFNEKTFVDIATAGRHRRLSFIFIKRNLFFQCKVGQDVELCNKHNSFFNSACDVMNFSTLSVQLELRSELNDWNRNATSVPYGLLLTFLSPRTEDGLRYSTNTNFNPSNFWIPSSWSFWNRWAMKTNNIFTLQVLQSFPPNCKSPFIQCCPKDFIRFLCEGLKNMLKKTSNAWKVIIWKTSKQRFERCF